MPTPALRLLAPTINAKGDLFTRLAKDFFFAMGYEDLHYDVAKSGREIDIQGQHRIEPKLLRAECKAHADKMGGAEINKFRGVHYTERIKHSHKEVVGYFLSLSGFTASALEQEKDLGNQGVNLIDAARIIRELEGSNIIANDHAVTEQAGRCAERAKLHDVEVDGIELLGHPMGYLKAVYYARNKARTHFALLHHLTPLAESVAREIVKVDKLNGGSLYKLKYLPPAPATADYVATEEAVMEHYRRWLSEECGFIQLDGLPADANITTKLELEQLFVPLRAVLPAQLRGEESHLRFPIQPIGSLLSEYQHVALLAAPGGGKSTLLKRLATAYAFPERLDQIKDELPDREWLPLFLRCRDLRELAKEPILKILEILPSKMSMPAQEAEVFNQVVLKALRNGQILLLIDGLDEISDEQARKQFAQNLRVFLAVYPQIGMVVTSREAGYRLVAGVIADTCQHARLAPFSRQDVKWLCVRWNVQAGKDTPDVRAEASQLAEDIWENTRIRPLAENPLLLTTLLVVKRWIGQLPRGRVALYNAAVKVLLMTWNVEGFEPLEEDETLTQLSYVACAMMRRGVQRISYRDLLALLQAARQELEAELQDARITAPAFIKRVEYRSSLLMRTGQELSDGELQDVYEFRHLTFQEYLAARGYALGEHPGRDDAGTLVDVLAPYFIYESWREVIPLATVMAKRHADPIIKYLAEACEEMVIGTLTEQDENYLKLLTQCLIDEAISLPETLNRALKQVARLGSYVEGLYLLFEGKYKERLLQIVQEELLSNAPGWEHYIVAYDSVGFYEYHEEEEIENELDIILDGIIANLKANDPIIQLHAALELKTLALYYESAEYDDYKGEIFELEIATMRPVCAVEGNVFVRLQAAMLPILVGEAGPAQLALCWALAWLTDGPLNFPLQAPVLVALYNIWASSPVLSTAGYAMWAIAEQVVGERYDLNAELATWPAFMRSDEFTRAIVPSKALALPDTQTGERQAKATVLLSWYARAPWSEEELVVRIKEEFDYIEDMPGSSGFGMVDMVQATTMLHGLGNAGQELLKRRTEFETGIYGEEEEEYEDDEEPLD